MIFAMKFALISLIFMRSTSALTCPNSNLNLKVFSFVTGHCFYVEARTNLTETTFEDAENECGLLGEGSHRWSLPKLDSDLKSRQMVHAIRIATGMDSWMIWLGLRRVAPVTISETLNSSQWGDKSKWRWTADGSTLEDSFPSNATSPPWLPTEPSNGQFRRTKKAADMERCVVTEKKQQLSPRWYDISCEARASHFFNELLHDYVFVCESFSGVSLVPTESIAVENSTQGRINETDTSEICTQREYRWQWMLLGMMLGAVVGVCVLIGAYYLLRNRKITETEIVLKFQKESGETDGQQQAQWMGDSTDDREQFF